MKNLTRVLALVLALSLVLGTVAFASFTDVKAGDDYAEAIETLAALGIIKGYEDGSFGAEKAITRAEAVAIVNRIQGLEKAAAGAASASLYTDVAADHWAAGDINLATQMGIISGDGNGKFRPEDQVSYQEMVKMLTCAVNYQPAVEELGGWPTGYLVAAQTYGILEDTTNMGAAAANRGIVAQLTFNTLTAPLMVQEGFGTNKTFKVKDGSEGDAQTLLDKKLKIYKMEVEVAATDKDAAEVGTALIDINDTYKVADHKDFYEVVDNKKVYKDDFKVYVGESTIGEKKDYTVVAYLKQNADKQWVVLHNAYEDGKNIEVFVAAADIEEVVLGATKPYILVTDENEKETKYYIDVDGEDDDDTKLYFNDIEKTITENIFKYNGEDRDGQVKFLYKDKNTDTISKIYVEDWKTDRVVDVAPNGKSIFLSKKVIKLDEEENDKLVYSLTMDGKDIAITDLKEDDVITYIEANGGNYFKMLVSRATVEGAVDAYYKADKVYTIAGNDYEVSQSARAAGIDVDMDGSNMAGVSGVFFLDAFGKIVGYSKNAETKAAINYGYILTYDGNLDDEEEFNYEATARILTKEGVKEIEFADTVSVTVVTSKENGKLDTAKDKYEFANPDEVADRTAFKNALDAVVGTDLIDYTVNSDGKISAFAYYVGTEVNGENSNITKNTDVADGAYNERNSKIGNYTVDENTVIFFIGANHRDDYVVTDISFLEDETVYAGTIAAEVEGEEDDSYPMSVYGMDEDRVAGALLIRYPVDTTNDKAHVAVFVTSSTVKNEDDEAVTKITYYQDGELKTIMAEDVLDMDDEDDEPIYEAGDVVTFKTNTKGLLVEEPTIVAANDDEYNYAYPELSKQAQYVYGQLVDKKDSTLKLGTGENVWENHKIDADAKVYIVEKKTNGKINVTAGSLVEVYMNRYYGKSGIDGEGTGAGELFNKKEADNYQVLLKYIDGDVIDVVVYKNFLEGFVESDDIVG